MKRQLVGVVTLAALLPIAALAQGNGKRQNKWADLSGDERARLHSAHEAAIRDPSVAESRERFRQARQDFREKLRGAILRADPSVQPILEKMRRDRRGDR